MKGRVTMDEIINLIANQGVSIALLVYIIYTNTKREQSNEQFNHELVKQIVTDKAQFDEMKELLNRNYSMISENRLNIEKLAKDVK